MKFESIEVSADLTIAGAGMPGICAAIEAARSGLKVSLINNRGYLGGNASPEVRIDICGADGANEFNFYARESGILEELRLENLFRNPQGNVYLWHNVLVDWVLKEKNIRLFLNTNIDEVITDEAQTITKILGSQLGTEKRFTFTSPLFVDDTGDGTIGYLAGADYRLGREAKEEFNERIAPEQADDVTLLSTLSFYTKDTHRPAPYTLPDFVNNQPVIESLKHREIPDRVPGHVRYEGYRMQWFYETGYGRHPISDAEEIIHDHRQLIYSVWDHIKNSGDYDSSTYDFEYISGIPGKRESRRLMGDHILSENDIVNQVDFDDVIGHGGWSIDLHADEGFFSKDMTTHHYNLNGIYGIPFKSCYSKNVTNLFVASRCMSTTHVAFGTTRVMGTLSTIGQAVGKAAALCMAHQTTPRAIANDYAEALQQALLKNDQHILGHTNKDAEDLAKKALVEVSSTASLTLPTMTDHETLNPSLALILPVEKTLGKVGLLLKASKDTSLDFTVYTSKKLQNYKPELELVQSSISLKATDTFEWHDLPINCSTDSGKLFIQFHENDAIRIGTTSDNLNGVFSLFVQSYANESTYVDIETHKVKTQQWAKLDKSLCFRLDDASSIYGSHNILNGYNRNYGLPNIWLSDADCTEATVTLDFNNPITISQLNLTFDSNLSFYYDNVEVFHDFNVMPELVKDYSIYGLIDGQEVLLSQVKNNHQRANRVSFQGVTTNRIKVVLENTNGAKRFGLYEIRAYA